MTRREPKESIGCLDSFSCFSRSTEDFRCKCTQSTRPNGGEIPSSAESMSRRTSNWVLTSSFDKPSSPPVGIQLLLDAATNALGPSMTSFWEFGASSEHVMHVVDDLNGHALFGGSAVTPSTVPDPLHGPPVAPLMSNHLQSRDETLGAPIGMQVRLDARDVP